MAELAGGAAPGSRSARQVGISAPQGCGKTTLVSALVALLTSEAHAAAAVSIDDFYLRGAEQEALAASAPGNPLLAFRGNAGTHDLALASTTLSALRSPQGRAVAVPLYDKTLRGGRGDRAPEAAWPVVREPLQVVLLEGWCLGFRPLPSDGAAEAQAPGLGAVNAALRAHAGAMEDYADCWVVIQVGDPSWVYSWRAQAEAVTRAAGKPALTEAQVADFVQRFMPAYAAYLPGLYAEGPTGRAGAPVLSLAVDATRTLQRAAETA